MKKIIFIAIIIFIGVKKAEAQVTFRQGLRGGANFAHFSKGLLATFYDGNGTYTIIKPEVSNITDFYIGAYGAIKLTKRYTLQPEITYSRQGSNFRKNPESELRKYKVSYISSAILNKFTFNDKFNIHFGPTLDIETYDNIDSFNAVPSDLGTAPLDLTLVLGAGYNFTSGFGLEARIKKGLIGILGFGYHTNVVMSLGATYTFKIK